MSRREPKKGEGEEELKLCFFSKLQLILPYKSVKLLKFLMEILSRKGAKVMGS